MHFKKRVTESIKDTEEITQDIYKVTKKENEKMTRKELVNLLTARKNELEKITTQELGELLEKITGIKYVPGEMKKKELIIDILCVELDRHTYYLYNSEENKNNVDKLKLQEEIIKGRTWLNIGSIITYYADIVRFEGYHVAHEKIKISYNELSESVYFGLKVFIVFGHDIYYQKRYLTAFKHI